ncbi:MAG TPA: protein phosphatase CheZ [Pseudolabrys sp.]|nr:protein phosphatase CheZ [Pseudolabrys sp.]
MQRKVFRVEQMTGRGNRAPANSAADNDRPVKVHQPIEPGTVERDLTAIHDIVAQHRRELSALITEGKDRRMARAAGELNAAVEGMEKATQRILASAEIIDDCARALASALDDDYHLGLAQDVQDHVVRIYEACNFQDLAGQRIGKVIATLMMIEERIAAMVERYNSSDSKNRPASPVEQRPTCDIINGPRLDGDSGHASQCDIDAIFA